MPHAPSHAPSHALLAQLHRAAIEGVLPYPHTFAAVERWLARRETAAPVHILALGKAAPEMARGALSALQQYGELCAGGVIIAAHRPDDGTALPLTVGDHPTPDLGSLAAADAIARTVSAVNEGDDILVLLSGGTTSLCAAPCAELSAFIGHPADAQTLIADAMDAMAAAGMAIHEMNAIRRRLLRWGAGRLATALAARGARSVQVMAVSDVAGDEPSVIGSGPCTADPLQLEEVLAICDAYGLRSLFPPELARVLGLQGAANVVVTPPAPSHAAFDRVHFTVVAGLDQALRGAAHAAEAASVEQVLVVPEPLAGDAGTLGAIVAQTALRCARSGPASTILIWGGEPTVRTIDDAAAFDDDDAMEHEMDAVLTAERETLMGHPLAAALVGGAVEPLGGRMQTLALAAAIELDAHAATDPEADRITILAAGTDGRDGPTDAAGAIVDRDTARDIQRAGRDPERDLKRWCSHYALDAAGALLRTGPTGTNVTDVVIAHISARRHLRLHPD